MDLKEQYNHIIESIPLGYTLNQVLVDEDGNPSDIIILEANSQFEQNMGIKKMDIVEKSIKSILPDADDEMIRKYGRVALTGEPLEMEYYSKTLQKYFKVKVTSPAKNYLISYFTDITEYKNQPDGSYEKIAEYHSFSERSKSLNEQTQSANEELEKKKNLFQSLFDVSTSIKLIIEFDSGRIVNANKAAMDFYKYTFEEITNLNINQINTLTDEQIRHEMELAKENRRNYFNFKHRLKNGEIRDVEVYSDKVIIDDKIHLYSIIHDITERKLLEKEVKEYTKKLAESELKFRQMYENTSIGIAVVSLDFTLRAANAAYCQMLGYDEKELIGKTIRDITHPEILDKNLELQTQLILGEIDSYQLEKKFIHKDGHTVFGLLNATIIRNTNGEPLYFLGNVQDITERKMMEFELIETKEKAEKNEQKYKNLFTNMMNGFGIHEMIFNENGEPIDYVFLEVNPAWEKLVNAKADLVIGKRIKEFMPYIEPSWIERYGKIVKTGIPEEFTDYNEATKKYYNVFAYKLDGNKFATVFNDVTDKKQFETDLIRAKEKAEESDRLKSAFLQNMSHEIRTPLNAIFGFAGILNKPDLSDEKRKSFVSIIQNSSHQLLDIINNIITLASLETKQERIHIDKVCINNIIVDLHAIFKHQSLNKNISIYSYYPLTDKESEIYTDKTKVTQILSNLIYNALKFTHEGFVEFGYNLRGKPEAFEMEFFVKDTGIGINPEIHQTIFERFRQADETISRKYGGTGLGLAISKEFVEMLGGRIWVNSEIGKGSTFYFTLPYKPVHGMDPVNILKAIGDIDNKPTILVAEDEEFNFLYMEELLIRSNYSIFHAKNGEEAVEIFKSNPNISLILMDIKMPVMDGHTAATIIKQLNPQIPIVAQSAYALEPERVKYEAVFDDYLVKPIDENDLVKIVSKYIGSENNLSRE